MDAFVSLDPVGYFSCPTLWHAFCCVRVRARENSGAQTEARPFSKVVGRQPIPGTRKCHKFVPVNEIKMKALEISFDENGIERSTQKTNDCIPLNPIVEPHNGDYIVCKYNETNWVGFVELCDEFNDFGVSFLYPSGSSRYYYFPEKKRLLLC